MPDAPAAAFRRHELVWVAPAAWAEALGRQPEAGDSPVVENWAIRGWPAIVRRCFAGEMAGRVPVGVPLPPALGKRRIALSVDVEGVTDRRSLTPLRQALECAPENWRAMLADVISVGQETGLRPSVFGSLLWQHLTGLSYVSATSDLDLLWPAPAGGPLRSLLGALAALDKGTPRLDGEIVFPDGVGVNWRELWRNLDTPDAEVLGKSHDHLRLISVRALAGEELAG